MRCLTKSVKLVMKGWTVRGGESERERGGSGIYPSIYPLLKRGHVTRGMQATVLARADS